MTAYKRALAGSVFLWALTMPALHGQRPSSPGAAVAVIEGSIVDDALEPLAGVPVTLARAGRRVDSTRTDKAGAFRFSRVEPGTYELTATRAGYAAIRKAVPVTRAGATVQMGLAMPRDSADVSATAMAPSSPAPVISLPQGPSSIAGVVTDTAGGVLPGVTVTARQTSSSATRTTVSTPAGTYELAALPAGTFRVTFELAGFTAVTRDGVVVRRDAGTRLDQKLEVGGMSETVMVTAGTPMVSTNRATVGQYDRRDRPQRQDTARYAHVEPNRFNLTAADPLSTFGADVDTASYTNVRRFLNEGRLPPADAVRVEEFVNYFKFDYNAPVADRAVGITSEVGACPWAPAHKLVLVGARAQSTDEGTAPRNLVFLIDVSGSMQPAERLPLLKTALAMFVDTLRPTDEISIVTYASGTGVALRPTTARHRDRILDAIASLGAGGSTNGGAGLMLAYRLAREQFVAGGVNRIILATDGDFNVGVTGQRDLYQLIDREKRSGVFLSVLGVGTHNLQDQTMEMLADKGNGHYAYLDSLQEARRVLIREGSATLETVAKDVKFQVEFNPAVVQAWKLIGYENRLMAHDEFNDDRKDGGELGAGHTVTVLYEVVPMGAPLPAEFTRAGRPAVDPLIYQADRRVTGAARRDEVLTVRVRYKRPDESESVMFNAVVKAGGGGTHLSFASAVAEFGLLLRDEDPATARWDALVSRAQTVAGGPDPSGERSGFVRMVELAAGLRRLRF